MNLSLEKIQNTLKSPAINTKILQSFESAKKDIRMEEPIRIVTRFAFDFVRHLF